MQVDARQIEGGAEPFFRALDLVETIFFPAYSFEHAISQSGTNDDDHRGKHGARRHRVHGGDQNRRNRSDERQQ